MVTPEERTATTEYPEDAAQSQALPDFLRACAAESVTVQPFVLRNVADLIERLDQRVHDQTHARIHAELAIESALGDIERGRQYDAEATLRRALENGRQESDG